ncbi:MAG: 30S ribosomal protein S20 [Acidobacteriota bacterium]
MANHKSAAKRAKQSEVRRIRNRGRKTRMKNAIKGIDAAAANPEAMVEALKEAISVIGRTASKGVIHKNQASRKISRLTKRVNAIVAAKTA